MFKTVRGAGLALLLALGLAALGPGTPAPAQTANAVLMSRRTGDVQARRGGSDTWAPIISSKFLSVGDLGRTGKDGQAQVKLLEEKVVLGVGPATLFAIQEVVQGFGGKVHLNYGRLRPDLDARNTPDRFQVTTPNAVLSAQGTIWTVHHVAVDPSGNLLGQEAQPENWPGMTEPDHTRAAIEKGTVKVTSTVTGEQMLTEEGDTVDIGPDGKIYVNPPDFAFPAQASEGPEVEKSTGFQDGPENGEPGLERPGGSPHTSGSSSEGTYHQPPEIPIPGD